MQAVQIALCRGFNDRARTRHVAFERGFEFFDRVQARFGRREFAGRRAIARLQFRNAHRRRFAARRFGRRERALMFGIVFETGDERIALREDRARARRCSPSSARVRRPAVRPHR